MEIAVEPGRTKSVVEFFDRIKRERLARRGLSSGRKRRKQDDKAVSESLESSEWVRFSIYGVFVVVGWLLVAGAPGGSFDGEFLAGGVVTFVIFAAAVLIFHFNHPQSSNRSSKAVLVIGGLVAQLLLVRGVMALNPPSVLLVMPVAFVPLVHSVLLGQRLGTFSTIFCAILGALVVQPEMAMEYLAFALVAGYTGVLATRRVKKREKLLRAGLFIGLVGVVIAIVFEVVDLSYLANGVEGWKSVAMQIGFVCGMGVLTGLVVSGLLPLLEGVFLLTTEISWLEMSDLNHKLLKRMSLEAPGTFHHSLMVAQLSESAAEVVGANSSMCRVAAYFHDIGKLSKPEYFVENQVEVNPHDELTPTMSALVIVAHVKDGVDMAIKEKLAPEVIDVIEEHHGDSLVYYFYRKALEQREEQLEKAAAGAMEEDDVAEVDEDRFRYPGPRPQTQESGIISLADAVESASRSLEKPTPKKIQALVDEIVLKRIEEGQLDDCGLTLTDVREIRKVFAKTLRSMLHTRIAYPEDEKKKKKKSRKEREERTVEAENVVPVEELERRRRAGNK
ncbi:MAG: HDIG domain-containing metalloprotein [Verrucomicrobiota bacterium]